MDRKLYVVLESADTGESPQTICQPFDEEPLEVVILAFDGQPSGPAYKIIVAYEGSGAFSIRPQKGSKIRVLGSKVHRSSIPEQ